MFKQLLASLLRGKPVQVVPDELLRRLNKLATRLPGMVYQYRLRPDGSACFPYASDAMAAIYRLCPEDVLHDAAKVLARLHPDDYASTLQSIQASAHDLSPWQHEYRVKFDDGTVRWLFGNALPEREADGATLWHGFVTDITERIELQEQRHLSDLALQAISQGVLISNADGIILSANDAFLKITGYRESQVLGRTCNFVQGPRTDKSVMAAIRQAQVNATEFKGEILNYREDGRTFWNELSISPVFDAQGRVIHFIGITRDITLRKLAEEAISQQQHVLEQLVAVRTVALTTALDDSRKAREQLQMALKGANAGCYEWNIDTGETRWSHEVWALNGMVAQDTPVNYATWRQTVQADDLARLEQITQAAVSQRATVEVEWQVNLPPGAAPRWLMSRAHPLPEVDGRVDHYRGIIIDITQRRQAELSLERYRDQLEERVAERTAKLSAAELEQRRLNRALRLLSACNSAIAHAQNKPELLQEICRLVVQTGGYQVAWVGVAQPVAADAVRMVAVFGSTGDDPDRLQSSCGAAQADALGLTRAALRTGTPQFCPDVLIDPPLARGLNTMGPQDGTCVAVLPLLVGGEAWGVLSLCGSGPHAFDAAEVQLLQELTADLAFGLQSLRSRAQLALYQQQLEKRVMQRTREVDLLNIELVAKARDAQSANLAKSAFLATMSHELRTPLNAVVGLTGLLADSPLNRRQQDYADKIQWSAQALRVLIDDILDFSRIEAGELLLEQAPFSLSVILRTTAAVVGAGLGHKRIEALFDVGADVPDALIGDALRLQQILLNLTSNAVKFTQEGVLVVAVRCLPRADASDTARVTLQFSVRDTGIGIAAEHLGPIFEGFTQAATSTSRLYGGSGLGLAISSRLATLMGGQIRVSSCLGQGSEFRLDVPLALGGSTPQGVPVGIPSALNILIVDDHPLVRAALAHTCLALGWQVTAVDSGAAGLEALRLSVAQDRDYDLMLLDWRMPGMDGLEMLRQAYALPGMGLPLVVLMASMAEQEQAVAASDGLWLDGFAAKPLTPGTLLEAVIRAHTGDSAAVLLPVHHREQRLAGLRLLVAEDNALNQEVVAEILTRAGAAVVMVADGLAAVTALRLDGAHFDAVLMDIQMPVMDGYSATRVIREELGLRDLPIIAVTAFARPQDREKSRLAGMVGHVVKPLDVEDLVNLLVAQSRGGASRSAPKIDLSPPALAKIIKLAGLDVETALKAFGGDGVRYLDLLRKFVAQHGGDVDTARRQFAGHEHPGALHVLHGLSGIAGFLQAKGLSRLACAAEEALRDGHAEGLLLLFDELAVAMQTVKDSFYQFEHFYAEPQPVPSPLMPGDPWGQCP